MVSDVLMPPMGLALGKVDFRDLFVSSTGEAYAGLGAAKTAGARVIAYGEFINTVINFWVIALVIFMIVNQANRFKQPVPVPARPAPKDCPYCATAIPM